MKILKIIVQYIVMLAFLTAAVIGGIILPEEVFRRTDLTEHAQIYSEPMNALDLTLTPEVGMSLAEKMAFASRQDTSQLLTDNTKSSEEMVCHAVVNFFIDVNQRINSGMDDIIKNTYIYYTESALFFDEDMNQSIVLWHVGAAMGDSQNVIASLIVDDETLSILGVDIYIDSERYEYNYKISRQMYWLASGVMETFRQQDKHSYWKQRDVYIGSPSSTQNCFHISDSQADYQFTLYLFPNRLNFNYYYKGDAEADYYN